MDTHWQKRIIMVEIRSEKRSSKRPADVLSGDIYGELLPGHLQLIPGLSDVYELELAFYESKLLTTTRLSVAVLTLHR